MIGNPSPFGNLSLALWDYLERVSRPEPSELAALRQRTAALPFVAPMQGSPAVGRLLQFLIQLMGARRVLEVGVFTGCSTLAMAMALPPDGKIVAIDITDKWASLAQEHWTRSGCADRIELRIGPAEDVLDALVHAGFGGTFDLAFIDANKDGYEKYFERAFTLVRDGGVMVFDNVLFGGSVLSTAAEIRQAHAREPHFLREQYVAFADGIRRFNARIADDARVDIVVLPMCDGVTLVRKRQALNA